MLQCMDDSAHDKEHVYRVLRLALELAQEEPDVDYDVLIAACLLHDIGRREQFADPSLDHAAVGGDKACRFLMEQGFSQEFASAVRACIETHRYRSDAPPRSLEAKLLFDADKLDVTGAMGIARTLLYEGGMGTLLYVLNPDGSVSQEEDGEEANFFQEYNRKLKNLYGRFYTEAAARLARPRREAAESFYRSLLEEIQGSGMAGERLLEEKLEN